MPQSVQLILAGLLVAGVVAVWLRSRRRRVGRRQPVGTGALVARGDGTATFVCDLCSACSPASNSRPLLMDWAHKHAAQYHPGHAHLAR
jgi:hypothetical protein